jgi:hypothetical protein
VLHPGPGELWPTARDHAAHASTADSSAVSAARCCIRDAPRLLEKKNSIFLFSLSRQLILKSSSPGEPGHSRGMARGAVVAGAAGLCVFLNSLHGELVFDDVHAVERNQDVLGGTSLSQLFLNDFWGEPLASNSSHKSYRPLTTVSDAFPRLVQYR